MGGQWSTTETRDTYVDVGLPPTVSVVTPRYDALQGGSPVVVSGTNLAPTAQFACQFVYPPDTEAGGSTPLTVVAPATFVSASEARCVAPAVPSYLEAHDAALSVKLFDAGSASPPVQFTFYTPTLPPSVSVVTPN